MKKVIAVIVLSLGLMGSVSAEPVTGLIFAAAHGGFIFWGGTQVDQQPNPDMHKDVLVSHAGETGYNFTVTQFEYDQSPAKYDIK